MSYRTKTPVLCFYEYVVKGPWGPEVIEDTVMVKIEFPDQLEAEFDRVMRKMTVEGIFKVRPIAKPRLKKILAPQHVKAEAS